MRREKALKTVEELLLLQPDYLAGLKLKATLLMQQNDLAGAATILERLLTIEESPDARIQYAEVLFRLGRFDPAIVQLEAALTKAPNRLPIILTRLAQCFYKINQMRKCYTALCRVEQHIPLNDNLKKLRVECFRQLKAQRLASTNQKIAS